MSTDLKHAILSAEVALLEAEAREIEAKLAAAAAKDVRYLPMIGEVGTQLVGQSLSFLHAWQKEDRARGTKQPIHITMNLVQGDDRASLVNPYIDTFALVDYLRFMVKDGYDITMQVTGSAVQHGAVLLQTEGIKRIITPHSQLMFTEEDFRVQANSSEMRDKLKFYRRLEEHAREIVTQRSGDKVTMERLAKETEYRRQWWIDAKTVVELGLADDVDVVLVPGKSYSPNPELMPLDGDSLQTRKLKAKCRCHLAQGEANRINAEIVEVENQPSTVMFIGGVGLESCAIAAAQLQRAARRSANAELNMLVYSQGGSVVDGTTLLDVINKIKSQGHTLSTTTIGCAASMGGFLLQSASERKRRIGKHSRILIHRMSRVFGGGNSQSQDQESMTAKLEESVLPMLIERSDVTMAEYMEKTEKSDWWVESGEALKRRMVDEVI